MDLVGWSVVSVYKEGSSTAPRLVSVSRNEHNYNHTFGLRQVPEHVLVKVCVLLWALRQAAVGHLSG